MTCFVGKTTSLSLRQNNESVEDFCTAPVTLIKVIIYFGIKMLLVERTLNSLSTESCCDYNEVRASTLWGLLLPLFIMDWRVNHFNSTDMVFAAHNLGTQHSGA